MTISAQVSVNGNYKIPIKYKQGDREVELVLSGRDSEGPNVHYISFYHGPDILTLEMGPEEPDNGESVE